MLMENIIPMEAIMTEPTRSKKVSGEDLAPACEVIRLSGARSTRMPGERRDPLRLQKRPLLDFRVYDAERAPRDDATSYSRGFRKAFRADPSVFSHLDIKDILVAGNGLAVALEDGIVRAGFYYVRGFHGGESSIYLKGMFSHARTPALIRPLTATAWRYEIRRHFGPVGARADVRVSRKGDLNLASSVALTECGLSVAKIFRTNVTPRDAHLLTSCTGGRYMGANMQASAKAFAKASQRILDEWGL